MSTYDPDSIFVSSKPDARLASIANRNTKRPRFEVIYCGPADEMDEDEVYEKSFGKLSYAERLMGCWELVERAWLLKGRSLDELRFNRTVAVLKRV